MAMKKKTKGYKVGGMKSKMKPKGMMAGGKMNAKGKKKAVNALLMLLLR